MKAKKCDRCVRYDDAYRDRKAGHKQVKLYAYFPNCGAKMDGGEKANE